MFRSRSLFTISQLLLIISVGIMSRLVYASQAYGLAVNAINNIRWPLSELDRSVFAQTDVRWARSYETLGRAVGVKYDSADVNRAL